MDWDKLYATLEPRRACHDIVTYDTNRQPSTNNGSLEDRCAA